MAQDPRKPKNDGKVGLPPIDGAMNKRGPQGGAGGKGSSKDKASIMLGAGDSKADKDQKILDRGRKRMDIAISSENINRKEALDDRKFITGEAQWPAEVAAQRNFDQRPCLTINKLPTFINQVCNDQRQNRPSINISPVGEKGDVEVAKMYRGLIRQIERASVADIAYDTAFQDAVSSGFGYWRVATAYENPKTFDQVLEIKRIRNPFTVYCDPSAQEPDGSDMRWAFISEMMPRSEFKEKYPDNDQMPFTLAGVGESLKNWVMADQIRIAEYFEITHEKKDLVKLSNNWEGFKDEIDEDVQKLIDLGDLDIIAERETEIPHVKWYKLTATEILDREDWLGKWIPIVKVIGNEIDVEGRVKLSGLIRNAKDSQRIYNYGKTSEIEVTMLAPKAPYIMEEGQVEGHETAWSSANVKSNPYLLYKGVNLNGKPAPPPQRQPVAQIPAGIVNVYQGAAQDMMATTGLRFDAGPQERMYDESGRALRELKRVGDLGSFHYVDNLMRSLRHCGSILVDLIPKIYDQRRMLTILRDDDTEERVQIDPNHPHAMSEQKDARTGKTLKIFNPTYGEYGVTVTIGPSYATKRIEAAESMMDFARALPNTASLIADLIAKNQDWPGAAEMATRLAKAVPANLLTPDQKDVPPQVQAMLQAMDAQIKQLSAERVQMMKDLTDKSQDRALELRKMDQDFEAKLLGVVQKAESSFNVHIGAQIKELGGNVVDLMKALEVHQAAAGEPTAAAQ